MRSDKHVARPLCGWFCCRHSNQPPAARLKGGELTGVCATVATLAADEKASLGLFLSSPRLAKPTSPLDVPVRGQVAKL